MSQNRLSFNVRKIPSGESSVSLRAIFQTRSALGNSPPLNTLRSSLGSDESAVCQREVDISKPRCTRPNPQLTRASLIGCDSVDFFLMSFAIVVLMCDFDYEIPSNSSR